LAKLKVLFCGESLNYISGLAYVNVSLIKQFYKTGNYEIGYATLSGMDTTREGMLIHGEDFRELANTMFITNSQILDSKTSQLFNNAIETYNPDLVISMIDPWLQDSLAYCLFRESFYWVDYVTIETPQYPEHCLFPTPIAPAPRKSIKDILNTSDLLVPCTSMGKSCLENLGLTPTIPISLGIDVDYDFKNEITDKLTKQEVFGNGFSNDDFVFFTVATNGERKMLGKIIEAFAKFKQKVSDSKNKYKLYIHTGVASQDGGTDLLDVVTLYGLNQSVFFPMGYQTNFGMSKKELYRRIQVSDCFVGLSGGEGFGYGYVEAMLHKKPVIYIDYGGHVEYCRGIGLPVKVNDFTYAINAAIKFAIADTEDCAKQMAKIISNKGLAERLGLLGYQYIQRFSWDIVGKQFIDLIEKNYDGGSSDPLLKLKLKRIM
jgi:glycosyltransferase involved in cell wall biosynthesis